METIRIRKVCSADIAAIEEIGVRAWEPIFGFYREAMGQELFKALYPDWKAEKARQIREACEASGPTRVLVVETEAGVVAFVTLHLDHETGVGQIGNNAVHPDFQGRGLGRMMYERVFDIMRKEGMRFAKVHTGGDPAHAPARMAYERVGFDTSIPGVQYYRKL